MNSVSEHSTVLEREMGWLTTLIDAALKLYFSRECAFADIHEIEPPGVTSSASSYGQMVAEHSLSFEERAVLALALAPYLRPQILDPFLIRNAALDRGFTEFGGTGTGLHEGFRPTIETAAFVLAGADLDRRLALLRLFAPGRFFHERKLFLLDEVQPGRSMLSLPLYLAPEHLAHLTTGERYRPAFNNSFPAQHITTSLDWTDLVLPAHVMEEVEEIKAWIEHRHTLLHQWGLKRQIKPGFRSLFYGPPGTGKTLTASLLGKSTGLDVYRVDLSLVVSKYIGETEKNLASVFDQAERNDWILFFDEADALFGKRTQTTNSHDRYANQEVAYLLQRVEDFSGIVILASNLKGNIDVAFARRFQSMIYFPVPGPEERTRLWKGAFSSRLPLDPGVDLARIGEEFEISGGAIVNVLRSSSLSALRAKRDFIAADDILHGIRREFRKDGKVV
ncbi:MAG TPA: ATP-binding protein [Candidatus Angelobacter sp.]|nr:ATP-binding protein [Candidatus Angelobacter sp.]